MAFTFTTSGFHPSKYKSRFFYHAVIINAVGVTLEEELARPQREKTQCRRHPAAWADGHVGHYIMKKLWRVFCVSFA